MKTDVTDNAVENLQGWVLYDGECSFCSGWARRFKRVLRRRGLLLATLQSRPDTVTALTEMRFLAPDGRVFGGADAVVEIARRVWWAWLLFALAQIPGVMPLLRTGYSWIAAHRHCLGGAACGPRRNSISAWLPLMLFPVVAFLLRNEVPPWVFMWMMAFALYAGCKWLTFVEAGHQVRKTNVPRALGYLLASPGMDAAAFLNVTAEVTRPRVGEWIFGVGKTLFGVALIWNGARRMLPYGPLWAGWMGMLGVVFLLHFGLFHLLSLAWRTMGVNAMPIMRNPARASSLVEFWGRRWNIAFHELMHRFTFRPMAVRVGAMAATLLVFLLSGLVHELVISLPARGGYGLPPGIFLFKAWEWFASTRASAGGAG